MPYAIDRKKNKFLEHSKKYTINHASDQEIPKSVTAASVLTFFFNEFPPQIALKGLVEAKRDHAAVVIDMDMDSEGVRKETVIDTTKVEGENYSELTAKSTDFFNAYPWLHSSILKKNQFYHLFT